MSANITDYDPVVERCAVLGGLRRSSLRCLFIGSEPSAGDIASLPHRPDLVNARDTFRVPLHDVTSVNPNARLEAFCDGVFAIALTLLVIDIRAPASDTIARTSEL